MKVVNVVLVMWLVFGSIVETLANNYHDNHVKNKVRVKSDAKARTTIKPRDHFNVTSNERYQRVETINNLADVFIRETPDIMNNFKLNPFHAPDQKETIAILTIDLKDIKIYNLTTLERTGDVIVLDDKDKHQTTIDLNLKFTKLRLEAMYKAYANIFLGTKGNVTARVRDITAKINVLIDFKELSAALQNINLSLNRNSLEVTLSGSLESELANLVMPAITTFLQDVIVEIIQSPLRKEINNILNGITSEIRKYLLAM